MGMVTCFAATDCETIESLRSDPERIESFLYPDGTEDDRDGDGVPPNYIELDKAWHCIHFMLSGSAGVNSDPLSFAILGGEEIGQEIGYGPARFLDSNGVRRVAVALSAIDESTFRSRYNPAAMKIADIYLADMCVRDGDDALDYLAQHYLSLVEFYRSAAERNDSVVIWVS